MSLVPLERTIPLRAIPEKELNRILLMDFTPYLTRLLSLTDETSAERLEIALPAIKEHCIGMGFVEIKKMFEMYVDNRLNIKPIPNYFDRILLGKIVAEYRSQKPKPKKMSKEYIPSEAEQDFIMMESLDRVKKEFEQHKTISSMCFHIYDWLDSKGKINLTKDEKLKLFEDAKQIALSKIEAPKNLETHRKIKTDIENINKGNSEVKRIAKRLALELYFNQNK